LSLLGTVDGLLGKTGSPQIGGIGYVRTIKGQPLLRLHGSLIGTLDGAPLRASGAFTALALLAPFTNAGFGLPPTGSYSGKRGDTPFSGRKATLQIPFLPDSATNIHDSWTLALNLRRKTVGKTERTFAAARLFLPDGNEIDFPERAARYTKT